MVKKFWVFVQRNFVWSVAVLLVLLASLGVLILLNSNGVALAKQSQNAPVVASVDKAPAAPAAPVVVEKAPIAPVVVAKEPVAVPQQAKVAEKVFTIRQVGGAEQIIKDWHNEAAITVSMPVIEDLGWEDIHETAGNPIYWVAVSSAPGTSIFSDVNYLFEDKGYVGVFMTDQPNSIEVITSWNDDAEVTGEDHYDVWAEAYVVSATLDKDTVSKRILAEWLVEQGKDVGFFVKSDGTTEKMKYEAAVEFNQANPPLFPDQLPQLAEGSKSIVMTVTQVGSGPIMKDWKNSEATSVKFPVEDKTRWEGIHVDENGNPVYLVLWSSDAGKLVCNGKEKEFKSGFVGACVTSQPESISVSTGWNSQNGNFNVWAEKYIVPADEDIDEILKEMLTSYRKDQGKPIGYAILSDGSVFEITK